MLLSTNIRDLEDYHLATIFKFLPYLDRLSMENVCEKWKFISKFQSWCNIETLLAGDFGAYNIKNFRNKKPPQDTIEKVIIRCGQFLNSIIINDYIESSIMRVVADHCCNIQYLQLGFNIFNPMDFFGVLEKLVKLETIYIIIPCATTPKLFYCSPNTLYFRPGTYSEPTNMGSCYLCLINHFQDLSSISLIDINVNEAAFDMISKTRGLKHLSLIFCKLPSNSKKIKKLVNLESLELERIANMENEFLQAICENLNNLKSIAIKNLLAPKITQQGFYLLSVPQSLKSIRICMMEREIDNTVFFQFENLIKLECCGCQLVTDVAIKRVLENCPALEVLNVMGTAVTVATIKLADIATRHRFGNASKLHLFIHQNIIKDFKCLNTPANGFLIIQHDDFWQSQTRVFN